MESEKHVFSWGPGSCGVVALSAHVVATVPFVFPRQLVDTGPPVLPLLCSPTIALLLSYAETQMK
jgi:hypothetical protein